MSGIQSVQRAFSILQSISAEPHGKRLSTIAAELDLPKSTISRMLSTLEGLGAVERIPNGDGFRLGQAVIDLVSQPSTVAAVARPYLAQLVAEVGEAASLCTYEDDVVHYLYQLQSPNSNIRIRDWAGVRVPMLHISSPGKLLLAFGPSDVRRQYLAEPLEQYTERTFSSGPQLDAHLADIKQTGVSWVFEEFERGLVGVSAPIFDEHRQIIAAANVYGPKFRFPQQGHQKLIESALLETVAHITAQIGGAPPQPLESIFTVGDLAV